MDIQHTVRKDRYFTKDHEWIDFWDDVAFIGVCKFKLTGFRQIQALHFIDASGFRKRGDVIATVRYNDYLIDVHMPVDGKVMHVNEKLVGRNPGILLDYAESSAWIALIQPSLPLERNDLLLPKQYQTNYTSK